LTKQLKQGQSALTLTAVVQQGVHFLLDQSAIGHGDAEEQAQDVCHVSGKEHW